MKNMETYYILLGNATIPINVPKNTPDEKIKTIFITLLNHTHKSYISKTEINNIVTKILKNN